MFFENKENFHCLEITKVSGDSIILKVIGGNKLETLVGNFFTRLSNMHQAIFEYTSQDNEYTSQYFRIHITRFNIYHKIFEYTSQDFKYTSQDIEHTSQDYRIYISRL